MAEASGAGDAEEWTRYVILLLAFHVLYRLWGGTRTFGVLQEALNTVSTRKYKDLVEALAGLIDTSKCGKMNFSRFDDAYSKHIAIANYKLSIVDGFLLSTAYVLSVIRSRGMLLRGLVSMFDENEAAIAG
jgi:hypothetical protein